MITSGGDQRKLSGSAAALSLHAALSFSLLPPPSMLLSIIESVSDRLSEFMKRVLNFHQIDVEAVFFSLVVRMCVVLFRMVQ